MLLNIPLLFDKKTLSNMCFCFEIKCTLEAWWGPTVQQENKGLTALDARYWQALFWPEGITSHSDQLPCWDLCWVTGQQGGGSVCACCVSVAPHGLTFFQKRDLNVRSLWKHPNDIRGGLLHAIMRFKSVLWRTSMRFFKYVYILS